MEDILGGMNGHHSRAGSGFATGRTSDDAGVGQSDGGDTGRSTQQSGDASRTVADSRWRQLGGVVLGSLAALVGEHSLAQVLVASEPAIWRAVGVLGLVGLAGPLLAGAAWVWRTREPLDGPAIRRVLAWCGAGVVGPAAFVALIVRSQRLDGLALAGPHGILLWTVGVGAVGGLLTGVFDVRCRAHRQRAAAATDRLSRVIETVPVHVVEHDRAGTVRQWDGDPEPAFGWTASDLVDEQLPFSSADDRETYAECLSRAANDERPPATEIELAASDGERRRVRVSAVPGIDTDSVTAVLVDVTDSKADSRNSETFRRAVEHENHAVYVTDDNGSIKYVNPAFEAVTGYESDEVLGEDANVLRPGHQDECHYRRLWHTLADGQHWEGDVVSERQSGEHYTAHQTVTPIYDDDSITGFVVIHSDRTVEQLREQRVDVLNRVLRHNLRTAVNIIRGHAELLRTELDDDDLCSHARTVDQQAQELKRLSEKARVVEEALKQTGPAACTVPLEDVLERVRDSTAAQYPSTNLTVECGSSDRLVGGSVEAALMELVENAIEHSDRPQQSVWLAVKDADEAGHVSISVADDGPGIPDQERVPVREESETPLNHGSGIGLWLVEWVTTALGGTVTIDDREPRGSVVTVTVPVAAADDDTELSSPSSTPANGSMTDSFEQVRAEGRGATQAND